MITTSASSLKTMETTWMPVAKRTLRQLTKATTKIAAAATHFTAACGGVHPLIRYDCAQFGIAETPKHGYQSTASPYYKAGPGAADGRQHKLGRYENPGSYHGSSDEGHRSYDPHFPLQEFSKFLVCPWKSITAPPKMITTSASSLKTMETTWMPVAKRVLRQLTAVSPKIATAATNFNTNCGGAQSL
ncbi:hypothetical protein EYF80_011014 [Liparis tanakae]|uniref:Uncharacterized protein n=1 Tax=Liparis tanakae TaxID=230148 RepID=A0A4Z2IMY8_9TELE|nr:hypothetical protein EYF80_011014 [Liparis tanakae]